MKQRCPWVPQSNPLYLAYHDQEWGKPLHGDIELFELLVLEGAQAGLSWRTVLNKREHYRKVFLGFDLDKVAAFCPAEVEALLKDSGIIRNRRKIESAVHNARRAQEVRKEFGSLDNYLWGWVDHQPVVNRFEGYKEVPASTPLSRTLSEDMKKRGFRFVGPIVIYAFMQAAGMVNDHLVSCFRHGELINEMGGANS